MSKNGELSSCQTFVTDIARTVSLQLQWPQVCLYSLVRRQIAGLQPTEWMCGLQIYDSQTDRVMTACLCVFFSHVVRFPLIYDLVLAIFFWQSCLWYHFNCEWKLHLTMVKSSVSPLRVKYKKVFSSFFNLFGDNYTLYVKYNYKRWSTLR